jgi:hypothetical protein
MPTSGASHLATQNFLSRENQLLMLKQSPSLGAKLKMMIRGVESKT